MSSVFYQYGYEVVIYLWGKNQSINPRWNVFLVFQLASQQSNNNNMPSISAVKGRAQRTDSFDDFDMEVDQQAGGDGFFEEETEKDDWGESQESDDFSVSKTSGEVQATCLLMIFQLNSKFDENWHPYKSRMSNQVTTKSYTDLLTIETCMSCKNSTPAIRLVQLFVQPLYKEIARSAL